MHASRQISRGRLLRTKAAPLQSRASPQDIMIRNFVASTYRAAPSS
jgi:hypothetical protein